MPLPYPLGVFTGNPGDSNAVAQFNNFATLVGATPQIINLYFDGTVNPDSWEGSVSYWVGEWSKTTPWNAPGVIPLIGMPMGSTDTTYTPAQVLQRYIAGTYDPYLQAVITEFEAAGYKTLYCRPGVEMNLSSTPGYSGYASNPALWIEAFQHIYTVLHAQATKSGVSLKVIWNPGVTASQTVGNAMDNLWPGTGYVDIIGLDNYADLWPWGPLTDATILSSTANMEHYYSYPAWNGTVNDASDGQCVSLLTTIAWAKAQGLPLAICETGAGAVGNGGPADNPVWWQWLRPTLDGAVAQGVVVEFVSMWNSNGGGTYQFTGGQQPNACAAIAAQFGINAPAVGGAAGPTTPPTPTFTVSPANTQINGTAGSITDTSGNVWAITAGQQITRNSTVVASSAQVVTLFWTGTALLQLNSKGAWWTQPLDGSAGTATTAPAGYVPPAAPPAPTAPVAPTPVSTTTLPQSSFTVYLAADEYEGNAQASITVDGKLVATGVAVTALHSSGQWDAFTWMGSYGAGSHSVVITFLNDAYGGTAATDRNLYFGGLTVDGKFYGTPQALDSTGSAATTSVTTVH